MARVLAVPKNVSDVVAIYILVLSTITNTTTHAHLSSPFRAWVDPYTGSCAILTLEEK